MKLGLKRRSRVWLATAVASSATVAAIGCGIGAGSFQLAVDRSALGDAQPVGGFVVGFTQPGAVTTCEDYFARSGCAVDLIAKDKLIPIRVGTTGKDTNAVTIPAIVQLDGGQDSTEVQVPVGVNDWLLIEAFSTDAPRHLVGTSCTPVPKVSEGQNSVTAQPFHLYPDGGVPCDPTRWAQ